MVVEKSEDGTSVDRREHTVQGDAAERLHRVKGGGRGGGGLS